jgi:hypothetical protein
LAETGYPVIVCTKGVIEGAEPYLSLIKTCNAVFQVSLISPHICEAQERHAPSFEERLGVIGKLVKAAKRVIVRCKPFFIGEEGAVKKLLPLYKDLGVWGVQFGGLRSETKRPFMAYVKRKEYRYEEEALEGIFSGLKEACHEAGLKFLVGKARNGGLYRLSDNPLCCGTEGLGGFEYYHAATIPRFRDGDGFCYTSRQKEKGTAGVFCGCGFSDRQMQNQSFMEVMHEMIMREGVIRCH